MHLRVVRIKDEMQRDGQANRIQDTVSDKCMESMLQVIKHPTGRPRSQAKIFFNADQVLAGEADTEFYINDTAYQVLRNNGVTVTVDREINDLPKGYGTVLSTVYYS